MKFYKKLYFIAAVIILNACVFMNTAYSANAYYNQTQVSEILSCVASEEYSNSTPPCVGENSSYYGEMSTKTGRPKTVYLKGYYRKNGTYVKGHYRSPPRAKNNSKK